MDQQPQNWLAGKPVEISTTGVTPSAPSYNSIPSFVEQMAMKHYAKTDVDANTIPWESVPEDRRQILIKAMSDIVTLTLDTCDD